MKRIFSFALAALVCGSLSTLALAQQKSSTAKAEPKTMTVMAHPVGSSTTIKLDKDEIIALQKALQKAGVYKGEATGTLDKATTDALRQYQEQNKLKPTGEPNHETLAKLGITLHRQPAAPHHSDAKKTGDKKAENTPKTN